MECSKMKILIISRLPSYISNSSSSVATNESAL